MSPLLGKADFDSSIPTPRRDVADAASRCAPFPAIAMQPILPANDHSLSANQTLRPARNRGLLKFEYVSAKRTELLFKIGFRRRAVPIGQCQSDVGPISGL